MSPNIHLAAASWLWIQSDQLSPFSTTMPSPTMEVCMFKLQSKINPSVLKLLLLSILFLQQLQKYLIHILGEVDYIGTKRYMWANVSWLLDISEGRLQYSIQLCHSLYHALIKLCGNLQLVPLCFGALLITYVCVLRKYYTKCWLLIIG